jgi:hypothetical protein
LEKGVLMAQTEHLRIYKAAYDLCLYFEQIVRNFSRYHKYTLGTELRETSRRALKRIVRANARTDKSAVLLDLREDLEELKVLLRLTHDAKGFPNFNSFEHAVRLVTDIARQNEGWLKSQRQGRGPTGASPSGAGRNRRVILDEVAKPSVP